MDMNVKPDVWAQAITAPQSAYQPPPFFEEGSTGGAPEHSTAIDPAGGSAATLTDGAKDSLLVGASELKASGASDEEIKSFVESELDASGVDVSGGDPRSGNLLDMMV